MTPAEFVWLVISWLVIQLAGDQSGRDACHCGPIMGWRRDGRLAMLGFVIGLATELLTGQGILSQLALG